MFISQILFLYHKTVVKTINHTRPIKGTLQLFNKHYVMCNRCRRLSVRQKCQIIGTEIITRTY